MSLKPPKNATDIRRPPITPSQSLFSPPAGFLTHASPVAPLAHPSQTSPILPELVLPAVFQDASRNLQRLYPSQHNTLYTYFACNLNVNRLIKIHKHLWMAGLPQGPRALHAHILSDRRICITETADLHLLWQGQKILLKPLPEYLTCYAVWQDYLCQDPATYEDSIDFLASYLWLVASPSDLKIAHEVGLISKTINWVAWSTFSQSVSTNLKLHSLEHQNPRYMYGELRLDRINLIYRFCSQTTNLTIFLYGYHYGYHNYSTFIERNFAWFLTFIVYVGLVLTAMQVGLATTELRDNVTFNRASYGFTVFAIIAPLIVVCFAGITVLLLVLFNARYALSRRQQASVTYSDLLAGDRMRQYQH